MLSLATRFTQNKVSTRLNTDIKDQEIKTHLCNHHSPKHGHIPDMIILQLLGLQKHLICTSTVIL